METRVELSDLNCILLILALPDGPSRHGYHFIAALDQGRIDPVLWSNYWPYCSVWRFLDVKDDEIGRLVHKPGDAGTAGRFLPTAPTTMTMMNPVQVRTRIFAGRVRLDQRTGRR